MLLSSLVESQFPTAADEALTKNLISYLYKADMIETQQGLEHRKSILSRLSEIVEDWSIKSCEHSVFHYL